MGSDCVVASPGLRWAGSGWVDADPASLPQFVLMVDHTLIERAVAGIAGIAGTIDLTALCSECIHAGCLMIYSSGMLIFILSKYSESSLSYRRCLGRFQSE